MTAQSRTPQSRTTAGPPGGGPAAARSAVPDLSFAVTDAAPLPHAAVPTLVFTLAIGREGGGPVRSVSLTTAVRIDVARRRYDAETQRRMSELFGAPEQWGTTVRPLAWARVTTVVPPFDERTTARIAVPCGCDAELAVTKYFHAVRGGDVPLDFLFSGTVFHQAQDGALRTAQISWAKDTRYDLPAAGWHSLVDRHHGGGSWLRLSRDVHDRLTDYRARHVLGGWDETVRSLLDTAGPGSPHTDSDPHTAGASWMP